MKDLNVENAELRKKLNARQIEVGYLDQLNVENAELREKLNAKQNEVGCFLLSMELSEIYVLYFKNRNETRVMIIEACSLLHFH